ncbi:MAG TPA: phosphoribosylglycinamide formyltransferase [Bacteroidia bacterium]|nr:phosphoribosylglycinamide formyltransferase [Bacteroidia bacterium]
MSTRIAIFASGSGTNAENIIRYFKNSNDISIVLILTNNPAAGVIEKADKLGVPYLIFSKEDLASENKLIKYLQNEKIDWIILAGFLWLVPATILKAYQNRIINIHPALLPNFGGKGFYGDKVHKAVISSGLPLSGISIHYVNEKFDEGQIIFQAACHVSNKETVESLSSKIHALEYKYFPVVIEKIIRSAVK